MMTLTEVPRRVISLGVVERVIGEDVFYKIPFPTSFPGGRSETLTVPWSFELKRELDNCPAFMLSNPYSTVGVLCFARSRRKQGNLLVIEANLLWRVFEYNPDWDEKKNFTTVCWQSFIEDDRKEYIVGRDIITSKIDDLRRLWLQVNIRDAGNASIKKFGNGAYDEAGLKCLIDNIAYSLNRYVHYGEVADALFLILQESDVSKRLDTAITLLNMVLESFEEWEEEIAVGYEKTTTEGETRGSLARRLIFSAPSHSGIVITDRIPEKGRAGGLLSLKEFQDFLKSRVVGQERAIKYLTDALEVAGADLLHSEGTLATVFFAGPTGVGKTEIALSVADFIATREKSSGQVFNQKPIIKIDATLFGGSLHHGVASLVGSPPGYVGSRQKSTSGDDFGVRPLLARDNFPKNRITVLLFDEIEKALGSGDFRAQGQELQGILITLLDKGQLLTNWDAADSEDPIEPTDFTRTIVIFTSNIGSRNIIEEAKKKIGFHPKYSSGNHLSDEEVEELNSRIYRVVRDEFERNFPAELVNRMGELIVFRFLTRGDFKEIITKEIETFSSLLFDRHQVRLTVGDEVLEWLLNHGIKREFGVRSLQRAILRKMRKPIARRLNAGTIKPGSFVSASVSSPNNKDSDWIIKVK